MFCVRLAISLLLAVAFLPGTSAAQYGGRRDSGQYVILGAQYGTARNHVDVTNRLKELARHDMVFRMGNSTFGVDPDHGQVKTLRIFARGPDGQQRVFEYREGSTVDGSQFRGWGRGEWGNERWTGSWEGGINNGDGDADAGRYPGQRGDRDRPYDNRGQDGRADSGQYVILGAQYGTARRHVDVTSRLKELARHDRVFRMGNSTFGVDPDHGHVKTLRIYARGPDGQQRMFEYREGSAIDGSQFRGWGRGEFGNEHWNGSW